MRHKLTARQSWIFFLIVLVIIVIATVVLGFVVNTPTSPGGLLSIGAFILFLILISSLSFIIVKSTKGQK